MNRQIRAREVRLIDDEGNQRGIVEIREAQKIADEAGLDLVEVAPNANPPVCRVMDFGKFLYQEKKRAQEAKKKQHIFQVKEVKFRPMIDPHDYTVKLKRLLRRVGTGRLVVRERLRRGDELGDLFDTFLQMTLGWFGRDPRLGLVQTPHHFYSPDPFERNLGRFRRVPNESELFHRLIQDGNDLWNASFFCGSCAVLRRAALDAIGGVAVETVTEDAHTALRMQRRGWNTAYINLPQAAGLATESLAAHIGQRVRWARGMVQILRLENPLFGPGLSIPQRLCYFNAAAHFLFAVPRLVFLTIPLVYLLLGMVNIYGHSLAMFAYALPHIVLSNMTNARVQGRHRFSFWSEVYETVLAPYVVAPTLLALISPRFGKFNVTSKGGVIERSYFDRRIALPFLCLLALNIAIFVIPMLFVVVERVTGVEKKRQGVGGAGSQTPAPPVAASPHP